MRGEGINKAYMLLMIHLASLHGMVDKLTKHTIYYSIPFFLRHEYTSIDINIQPNGCLHNSLSYGSFTHMNGFKSMNMDFCNHQRDNYALQCSTYFIVHALNCRL